MRTTISHRITRILVFLFITILSTSISAQQADSKSKGLLDALKEVNGGYKKLASKKDVQFSYVYDNMDQGRDVSLERHIFHGEHSWASYSEHKRNVLPDKQGIAVQSLVHGKPSLTLNGKTVNDEAALKGTVFLRKVNFYWFTMMYKLNDAGTIFSYLGQEEANGIMYDKVSLTYDSDITGKEANDEYILYFNPKTHLIDQFYFSLPAWGIDKPILKMTLEYEKVDGIYLTTVRKSYGPDENGKYHMNGIYTFKDIKFNNGFKAEDFMQ